jgi:hypothetical protein
MEKRTDRLFVIFGQLPSLHVLECAAQSECWKWIAEREILERVTYYHTSQRISRVRASPQPPLAPEVMRYEQLASLLGHITTHAAFLIAFALCPPEKSVA